MLEICLQSLTIIGIILLTLLLLVLFLILLVLFFPVTYRIYGTKTEEKLTVTGKAKWLFGLLRVNYSYPEPGKAVVRLLWFPLYDSEAGETETKESKKDKTKKKQKKKEKVESIPTADSVKPEAAEVDSGSENEADSGKAGESDEKETVSEKAEGGKFFQKVKKIKYTICNGYDKIKEIWENISYYIELLQEEGTKQLFLQISSQCGKIWRSIRPRHVEAELLFGTGSPDTTGYLYGAYCMAAPSLGSRFLVTPDFERKILEAKFAVSGHITLWVLLLNGVKLLLNKELKTFIRKLKAGKGKQS